MEFLLKTAYYGVTGISSMLIAFFFLANLFNEPFSSETWRAKAVVVVSGGFAIGLLAWAYRMGHADGQWLSGLALAALAVVAFGVMTFAGLLMFTRVHWQ